MWHTHGNNDVHARETRLPCDALQRLECGPFVSKEAPAAVWRGRPATLRSAEDLVNECAGFGRPVSDQDLLMMAAQHDACMCTDVGASSVSVLS